MKGELIQKDCDNIPHLHKKCEQEGCKRIAKATTHAEGLITKYKYEHSYCIKHLFRARREYEGYVFVKLTRIEMLT